MYFQVVDKYGNMTDNSDYSKLIVKNASQNEITIYADHIKPKIISKKVVKDFWSTAAPIPDSTWFRKDDKAHVEYVVQEYNIPVTTSPAYSVNSTTIDHFRKDFGGTTNLYADYSALATGSDPGVQISFTGTTGIKTFTVIGGDNNVTANSVTSFAIGIVSTGTHDVIVSAYDLAGNQSKEQIPIKVDNTSHTLGGDVFLAPVERIGWQGDGAAVNSEVVYINSNGITATAITEGIRKAGTVVPDPEYNGDWSQDLKQLNTIGKNKEGKTAYSRIADGFIGLTDQTTIAGIDYYQITYNSSTGAAVSMIVSPSEFSSSRNASYPKGIFIPNNIMRSGLSNGNQYIGQSADIKITAWDFAGNFSTVSQKNALMQDDAIKVPDNNALSIPSANGSGVTLQVVDNKLILELSLQSLSDNVGIAGFEVVSFADERGNTVPSNGTFTIGGKPYSLGSKVTSAAVAINAQALGDSQWVPAPGPTGTNILTFTIAQNALFIGGKVKISIKVYDHLGNSALIEKSYLVQKGISIKSQDSKSNREISTEINQGQEGQIRSRIEQGRK